VAPIEEKSTKPPGTARFYRRKDEVQKSNMPVFADDTFNVGVLCQQLLVAGYVQSYVDFYQLTHRIDPGAVEETGMKQISISEADTKFIRDSLVKAEVSRRQGDTANVYAAFNQLADYYVRNQDWKTAFFFHEKCLEVSQLTNDVRAEMSANHSLGFIYQLMNDFGKACAYHERHEEIATSLDVFEEVAKANAELYKVYLVLAEREENRGNFEEALRIYNQCLDSARKSWDKSAEADANGSIGNLLLKHGDAARSLPYLRQQSQISADLGNAEGRCRACSALALALDSMNQTEKALHELTTVMAISEEVGDHYLQAQACKALGTLFSKLGRLQDAVDTLHKHFQLTKKLLLKPPPPPQDPAPSAGGSGATKAGMGAQSKADVQHMVTSRDLDIARAYIGISRGNLLLGAYSIAMQGNLVALLDWKLNRTDITAKTGTATEGTMATGATAAQRRAEADAGDVNSLHSTSK
jgi:tetratricopeptide (TPR) repeat protein